MTKVMEKNPARLLKGLVTIIISIIAAMILGLVVRTICVNATIHKASEEYGKAIDKASKEYNKAYDQAKRDMDKAMKQFGY